MRAQGSTSDKPIHWQTVATPLGRFVLASRNGGLCGGWFEGQKYFPVIDPARGWREGRDAVLDAAAAQLEAWFAGRRQAFELPLALAGTPFQQAVWQALRDVPFGHTTSYAELARAVGKPRAFHAAGAAVGRNPLSVIVPCHRALGSDGSLTGYAGGLPRKRWLLEHENPAGRLFAQAAP